MKTIKKIKLVKNSACKKRGCSVDENFLPIDKKLKLVTSILKTAA